MNAHIGKRRFLSTSRVAVGQMPSRDQINLNSNKSTCETKCIILLYNNLGIIDSFYSLDFVQESGKGLFIQILNANIFYLMIDITIHIFLKKIQG